MNAVHLTAVGNVFGVQKLLEIMGLPSAKPETVEKIVPLNTKHLLAAIQSTRKFLDELDMEYSGEKEAEIISLAYQLACKLNEDVSNDDTAIEPEKLERYLKLITNNNSK